MSKIEIAICLFAYIGLYTTKGFRVLAMFEEATAWTTKRKKPKNRIGLVRFGLQS